MTIRSIRTAVVAAAALALSVAAPASSRAQTSDRQPPQGSTPQGEMQGSAQPRGGQQPGSAQAQVPRKVQDDLQKLHAANQSEIQAAQLAEQRATSPEVRQLAQTIAQQHAQADQQLQQWAQQQNVNLAGNTYQKELKSLQNTANKDFGNKQGEAFDRAYTQQMVKEHHTDLSKNLPQWIKDAEKAGDTQLVALLQNTQTVIQHHLQLARQAQAAERQQAKGQRGTGGTGGTGASSSQSGSNQPQR